MELTPAIAMSIVNRTMKHIKYNINIMNYKGTIIGSGDPSRISAYHEGASSVLKDNKTIEIKKGDIDYYKGAKEGVNLPIRFNGKPVGVVGITGDPDEVRIYGAMVKAMAELMLEEAFFWEQENIAEQAKFSLVNDLIRRDVGSNFNALIIRANVLGYNLNLPRVVAVFEVNRTESYENEKGDSNSELSIYKLNKMNKQLKSQLALTSQDLLAAGIGGRYVLLKHLKNTELGEVKKVIEFVFSTLMSDFSRFNAGIGKVCSNISEIPESFEHALQALEVGYRLFGYNQLVFSEELGIEKFVSKVGKDFRASFYKEILSGLFFDDITPDQQLIDTAEEYLRRDLKPGKTARSLFIHRNTLSYRIDKIKNKIGLDLNTVEDAFRFKLALMCYKYDNK